MVPEVVDKTRGSNRLSSLPTGSNRLSSLPTCLKGLNYAVRGF